MSHTSNNMHTTQPLRRSARLAAKAAPVAPPAWKTVKKTLATRDQMVIDFVRSMLEQTEKAEGKDNKVVLASTLFHFLTENAGDFLRRNGRFAAVVTAKAIELMRDAPEYPNLIIKLERFLCSMLIDERAIRKLKV